jgi:hypothetical protein
MHDTILKAQSSYLKLIIARLSTPEQSWCDSGLLLVNFLWAIRVGLFVGIARLSTPEQRWRKRPHSPKQIWC